MNNLGSLSRQQPRIRTLSPPAKRTTGKLSSQAKRNFLNNNRGQFATDMFDAVMIVIFSVIFFVIVAFALAWNTNVANKQPIKNIAEYHFKDSALNNLLASSSEQNFESQDLNELIKKSKILSGKVISTCNDYFLEEDCNKDIAGIHTDDGLFDSGGCCHWGTNAKCLAVYEDYCNSIQAQQEMKEKLKEISEKNE